MLSGIVKIESPNNHLQSEKIVKHEKGLSPASLSLTTYHGGRV